MKRSFWSYVSKVPGGCWLWLGTVNFKGGTSSQPYGATTIRGRLEIAHRVSWELCNGKIPHKKQVLRLCGESFCVNPSHLALSTPDVLFMLHVEKTRGCWEWIGSRSRRKDGKLGYGSTGVLGRTEGAHRVSWKLFRGRVPQGKQVLHTCDNCACVKPDHLYLGTREDNYRDRRERGLRGLTGRTILTVAQVRRVRRWGVRTADSLGVSRVTLGAVIGGANWRGIE